MPRPMRFDVPGYARFLTFSCYRRLQLLGSPQLRDHAATHLVRVQREMRFTLFAWVIMPEHVHLLLAPPRDGPSVSRLLQRWKEPLARDVLSRWRSLDAPVLELLRTPAGVTHFWQRGGGYDRTIRDRGELVEAFRYIELNPVRRGLVDRSGDWRWSSAFTGVVEPSEQVRIDPLPR